MILVSLFVKFLELLDDEDFLLKLKLKEKEEEDFEEAKKLAKKIVLMEQEERIKFSNFCFCIKCIQVTWRHHIIY